MEIAGLNWWWFLLLIAGSIASLLFGKDASSLKTIASLVTIFGSFVCNYNLAKKFHKDTGFAVLMTIFPVVLYPIIGFGKSYQYDSSVPVSKNGPFGAVESNSNVATNQSNNNAEVSSNVENLVNDNVNSNVNSEPVSNNISFCPNCGSRIEDGSKFCGNCGKEI